MVSSCSPCKQTQPCLQMKTNIDEIKLGKEYLISELNVWIKLGLSLLSLWVLEACHHYEKTEEGKTFFFLCYLFLLFVYFL